MHQHVTRTTGRRRRTATVLGAATLLAALSPTTAGAAFPGADGPIVFERGGGLQLLAAGTTTPRTLVGPSSYDPAVSPDGRRVAYEFQRDIWVVDVDGSDRRPVTTDAHDNTDPAWSPDGRRIVFATRTASSVDVAVVDAAGGAPKLLTQTSDHEERQPAWSPDGRQIAYERSGCDKPRDGGTCVFVMAADGSGPQNLTPELTLPGCERSPGYSFTGASAAPSWSPDSTTIAFTGPVLCQVSALGTDVWTMSRTGAGKVDLTHDDATSDQAPVFSPDGAAVLFSHGTADGSRGGLATVPAGGGAIVPLTSGAGDRHADWGAAPKAACAVPRLKGLSTAAARQGLVAAGCRLGAVTTRRSATVKAGRVLTQALAPGRSELLGTRVAVVVSAGRR